MIGRALGEFKNQFDKAKAELKGEARSHARLVKNAVDIPEVAKRLNGHNSQVRAVRAPQPTGAAVRMLDGKPMMFFDDGSIRHALGKRVTKAARKALKRAKRHAKKSA